VAFLAWQARRMTTALPSGEWLPREAESARAIRDLERMGRQSQLQQVRVLIELPAGVAALSSAGWSATEHVVRQLARDPRVGRVRALPAYAAGIPFDVVRALVPDSMRRVFVSVDSALALVEVAPRSDVEPTDAIRLVRDLRRADAAALSGLPGTQLLIGGLPAFNADYEDVVGGHFHAVIALVLGGTFIALLIGFRSVLVPVKAIAMNLLTVAAAYGAVVLTFQDGIGARLLGLDRPLDSVFPTLPVLVFCAVFGISMDYEVFLIARVAEARRAGMGERQAIERGLAATGGVITSAAAIMVVVFGAFALGDFLPTKMLGFALGVAVLIDATIVRLAIGPALLRLAGDWNWWPGTAVRYPLSAVRSKERNALPLPGRGHPARRKD
jgi:RND superfamily putative drug exporter